ncbi:BS18 [Elizabethkingia miricola]|uniref:Small ribosomal subunit protein uS15 n=5 Tax=Elizabethkingia TaxID=308865 RepID=A0ABY3NG61_ELIMR|nr:small subunit ribosomal protein S15 [Elizabethkingia miricola]SPW32222.1 BS18 [Elizabethkingia miricola]
MNEEISRIFAPELHNNHLNNIGMYLTKEKKAEIFAKHGQSATDTGSSEGQIALFTFRINHLSQHLKKNHKDFATEKSLVKLVGKRKRLLDYLKNTEIERYRAIIAELGIRK